MRLFMGVLFTFLTLSVSGERKKDYDLDDAPEIISRMLDNHLNGFEASLPRNTATKAKVFEGGNSDNVGFYLQRFLFRIQPFVTFDVGVANLKVSPFFEVRVKRTPPKGWEPYHP